jgi:hypothetical protein
MRLHIAKSIKISQPDNCSSIMTILQITSCSLSKQFMA